MKTIYKLTEDDVRTILATHFNVPEENVNIHCGMATTGYYMNECKVPYLKVEITLDKKEKI